MTSRLDLPFTAFLDLLGVALEAGQRAYARVAFDGVDPCDLETDERESARALFGPVDRISPFARNVVAVVAGGRSGKTYLSALRALHLALTADLSRLAPGERAFGIFVAPDMALAEQAISYATGALEVSPLHNVIEAASSRTLVIRRSHGRSVELSVRAASSKGKTGRGRNIICAILDESCFFFDAGYVVNDEDIYRAIAPRVVRGGQLIVQSTPWGKQGLLYDLWSRNFGSPQTCIAVHASTRAMRSDADQLAKIDAEYQRDPENARREFGAEFLDTDAQYLASDHIDACTRVDGDEAPIRGVAYVACVDPASRSNAFTLAIGRRTYDGGVAVSLVRQWLPERGSPLDLRAVVGEVAALAKRYGCDEVVSDAWSGDALATLFDDAGVYLRQWTLAGQDATDAWQHLRSLLATNAISLPADPVLRRDLCAVRRRVSSGGSLSFVLPLTPDGRHADYAPSVLRLATRAKNLALPSRPQKPDERARAELDRMWADNEREDDVSWAE